ncbi:MAG: hypothetical protein AAFY88_24780, partial [Acidobacteriota bacterium]
MTPDDPGFGQPPNPPHNPPPPPGAPPPPGYPPPPSWSPPAPGEAPPLPWEERQRLGFVPALMETVKLLVTDPQGAFSRLRADGDYLNPFLFGLIVSWVMSVISQMWGVATSSLFSFGD